MTVCTNCQTENTNEASFCFACGSQLAQEMSAAQGTGEVIECVAQPITNTQTADYNAPFQQAFEFTRMQAAHAAEAFDLKNAVNAAWEYHQETKRSYDNNKVATLILALIGLFVIVPYCFSPETIQHVGNPVTCAIGGVIIGPALFAWIPFGTLPIRKWMKNNGFFVVFNWIFLIVACIVTFYIAIFAALPYALYLRAEVKSSLKRAEGLSEQYNERYGSALYGAAA